MIYLENLELKMITIGLLDLHGTVIRLAKTYDKSNTAVLTVMSPSDTEEGRYAPAESAAVFVSKKDLKELGEWMIKQAETLVDQP